MLKILPNDILKDSLRVFRGNYGLQFGYNNKPLQVYDAYGDGSDIIFFYAHIMRYKEKVCTTFELSLDTILYADGQYYFDSSKFFDNVTPTNILPNGTYFLSFGNVTGEVFNSELFQVNQFEIDGSDSFETPQVKHFENDPIFLFND